MSDRLETAIRELLAALREELVADTRRQPDRLLSLAKAAELLGVGRSLLYVEIGHGRLRSIKVGRRRLVPESAIAEYSGALRARVEADR